MREHYNRYKDMVEEKLRNVFNEDVPQKRLLEAMRYSLLAGGKRLRPVIAVAFCEALGTKAEDALYFGAALEMLHTYSLIHDDLPCMDDDDLRRGKPTNHVVFGEYTAVLAGDALQAAAFEMVASAPLDADKRAKASLILAKAVGAFGMCGGQQLDMEAEGKKLSITEIEGIHALKTAALIIAAAKMGCVAAGAVEKEFNAAEEYASNLGIAFQIQDDILDYEGTTETLGKPAGSDEDNNKSTFVTLLGIEKCRELVALHTEKAKAALRPVFSDRIFLEWLADVMAGRNA